MLKFRIKYSVQFETVFDMTFVCCANYQAYFGGGTKLTVLGEFGGGTKLTVLGEYYFRFNWKLLQIY